MDNKNLISKIKNLMTQYGFIAENEPEYNSFKLEDETIIQLIGEIELEKEIFSINEETGERVVLNDGTYKTETLKFEVIEGKITSVTERFAEVKTSDGIVLKIDGEVAVGSNVIVVTEEGDIPAPDGVYELEDGTKIMVKDGMIEKVGEEDPAEPVVEPTEPVVEPSNEMDEIFNMLKTFIENVTTKMNEMSEQMSRTNEQIESVTKEFNEFKKLPAGNKIPNGKVEINEELTKVDRILRLRNK